MSDTQLALKVDVDTHLGTREGVPRLRKMLQARKLPASFFLSLGPDKSGRAIVRAVTHPGFVSKMIRTRAPVTYGFKTMLQGTLLPAPIIGLGQEGLIKGLLTDGHEVGLHAWDHVLWHHRLWKMPPRQVKEEISRGLAAYASLAGKLPFGFAAPAWRINAEACAVLEAAGLVYMSATRGFNPYYPSFNGQRCSVLEIPTTLPTADEVLGLDGITEKNLPEYYLDRIMTPGLHVMTVHAELEGRRLARTFERILDMCLYRKVKFLRLIDVAEKCLKEADLPFCEIIRTGLPGRPGKVSHQVK